MTTHIPEDTRINLLRARQRFARVDLPLTEAVAGLTQVFDDVPEAGLALRLSAYLEGVFKRVVADELDSRAAARQVRQMMAALSANDTESVARLSLV